MICCASPGHDRCRQLTPSCLSSRSRAWRIAADTSSYWTACNAGLQVFAFLGISTTNVLASQSPHAPGITEEERSRRTAHGQRMLCYLLTIAIVLGVVVVAVLQVRRLR